MTQTTAAGPALFLTVPQIAAQLGVGRAQAYKLIAEGRLPHVRRGRRVLVPSAAWEQWVRGQNERALAAAGAGH